MLRPESLAPLLGVLVLACTTRAPLGDLAPREQREISEAAVVEVCGFALDVESEITPRHREARATAMEYIAIASNNATEGELSRFFSAETLSACGPRASEWGGVSGSISQLVARYGSEAEMLVQLRQMSAPSMFCRIAPARGLFSRYRDVCDKHYAPEEG
jgi:hypothetical protein